MPGKVQLGPAWWWCDHEDGIRDVLEKNAAYGVLSTFVGMTTDSRSLLSFVRHDYFRRVLCKWVAEKVAAGAFPSDEALLRPLLDAVSPLPPSSIATLCTMATLGAALISAFFALSNLLNKVPLGTFLLHAALIRRASCAAVTAEPIPVP